MTSATRERLIAAGLELFSRHGIGQVGLDRVLQQAGLTKTTFYNHFDSKEELIREVLGRNEQELRSLLTDEIDRLGDAAPRDRVLAVFDALRGLCGSDDCRGALAMNAVIEFPAERDPTHAVAVTSKQVVYSLMLPLVAELGAELGAAQAELLAQQLVIVFDGTLINFQVTRDPATVAAGREVAALLLNLAVAG